MTLQIFFKRLSHTVPRLGGKRSHVQIAVRQHIVVKFKDLLRKVR